MANFLDKTGLSIVWARINEKFIAQPTSNVTADHVAKFTVTTDGNNNTIIGVADSGYTIGANVPSGAVFTDESTTQTGHYTPSTDDGSSPTLGNSDLAWNAPVVTGISKDSKGHIIGPHLRLGGDHVPARAGVEGADVDAAGALAGA